ncbi:MAG: ammonium transporter [Candidatus Actinomarina sp.]|jgi:Amt family ammonium transporter|tara:strand:- start:4771 stop:5970 length:1200 start_codon:yes stop_codon:yes gene_type:complete
MEIATYVDNLWIVVAGILVMFMQPGFMLVETGFTRSKNSVNIVMKNFMDFSVGAVTYWAFGFALAYGGTTVGGFLAYGNFFLEGDSITYFFQVVFAATAATIVSGAVAERTKFSAYLLFQPFICGVIYPIVTHWVWSGQGWLGDLGFIDFAGSGVVHMVGGFAALAGVQIVGPRIGKYDDEGNPQAIPGSSMVAGALGVFILWFGWYGFNVGSALAAVDVNLAAIAVTTTLSAASGSITAMYTSMISGKPNVGMTLNGALAGLVGITAGCANVNNLGAVLIGLVSGVLVVYSINFFEKRGFDDAVGAVSVHGICGIWGVLAVAIFDTADGLFYGGGTSLFGPQLIGILAIGAWAYGTSFLVFKVIDSTVGLRVTAEEEIAGLDASEHGTSAYGDFITKK